MTTSTTHPAVVRAPAAARGGIRARDAHDAVAVESVRQILAVMRRRTVTTARRGSRRDHRQLICYEQNCVFVAALPQHIRRRPHDSLYNRDRQG